MAEPNERATIDRKQDRERRIHDFFDNWLRITGGMNLEERGAYAELANLYIGLRKPITDSVAASALHVNARRWSRLKAVLAAAGAIAIGDGGITIPVLNSRLYRTGYSYKKIQVPQALRWQCFLRDGHACRRCGSREDLTADHIVAEVDGGLTILENLQTLCRPCNSSKGAQ